MLIMIWIPTSLLILLKVHSLTGECTIPSPGFAECISVDEEEIMSFMKKGFPYGPYGTHLKIVDSFISTMNISVFNLTIKNSWVGTTFSVPMEYVTFLDLSFNEISKLNNLRSTELKGLIMHHNRIKFLDGYGLCSGSDWPGPTIGTLDLSHNSINNFTGLSCTELTVLNLSHNLIERLSNLLVNLERVKIVDLSYNKLKNVNAEEIANLRNLKILNLSHNDIQSFQHTRNMNPAFSCTCADMYDRDCRSEEKYDLLDLSSNRLIPSREIVDNGDCDKEGHLKTISFENNDLKDLYFLLLNKSRMIQGNSLIFRNNKINKLYPYNFKGFKLKKLDLSLNEIESVLPLTFGTAEVNELHLDHNKITSLNSSTFSGLSELARLNVSFNPLSTIDELIFQYNFSSLRSIDLSHCLLEKIPVGLFHKMHLSEIYLSHNGIELIEPHTFPSVKILDLSNNKILNLPANVFSGLKISHSLDLSYNPLESIEGIFNNTAIRNVSLKGISLAKLSEEDFRGLKNIHSLDLSNNTLKFSSERLSAIKALGSLNFSSIGVGVIEDGAFYDLDGLVHLNLSHNKIGNLPRNAFVGLKKLKMLDLSFNKLTGKDSTFPIGIFKDLVELTNLHLQHNRIRKFHAGEFSNLRNLRFLNLSHNQLIYLDRNQLFALRKLEVLDINSNHVIEFDYLFTMEHLSSLKMIAIGDNKWSCGNLAIMLNYFEQRVVNYREISKLEFELNNIDGIYCVYF